MTLGISLSVWFFWASDDIKNRQTLRSAGDIVDNDDNFSLGKFPYLHLKNGKYFSPISYVNVNTPHGKRKFIRKDGTLRSSPPRIAGFLKTFAEVDNKNKNLDEVRVSYSKYRASIKWSLNSAYINHVHQETTKQNYFGFRSTKTKKASTAWAQSENFRPTTKLNTWSGATKNNERKYQILSNILIR